jgi:hypothetical protein
LPIFFILKISVSKPEINNKNNIPISANILKSPEAKFISGKLKAK